MHIELDKVRAFLDTRDDIIRLTVNDDRVTPPLNIALRRGSAHDRALRPLFAAELANRITLRHTREFGRAQLGWDLGVVEGKSDVLVHDSFRGLIPHLLVFGSERMNRWSLLTSMVLQLTAQNGPTDVGFALVLPASPLRIQLEQLDTVHAVADNASHRGVAELLDLLDAEVQRRYDLLAEHRVNSIEEARRRAVQDALVSGTPLVENPLHLPHLILVAFQLADLGTSRTNRKIVRGILERGGRVGVQLAVGASRALRDHDDFILPELHPYLRRVVLHSQHIPTSASVDLVGTDEATRLAPQTGLSALSGINNPTTVFRLPNGIEDEGAVAALVAELTTKYPRSRPPHDPDFYIHTTIDGHPARVRRGWEPERDGWPRRRETGSSPSWRDGFPPQRRVVTTVGGLVDSLGEAAAWKMLRGGALPKDHRPPADYLCLTSPGYDPWVERPMGENTKTILAYLVSKEVVDAIRKQYGPMPVRELADAVALADDRGESNRSVSEDARLDDAALLVIYRAGLDPETLQGIKPPLGRVVVGESPSDRYIVLNLDDDRTYGEATALLAWVERNAAAEDLLKTVVREATDES